MTYKNFSRHLRNMIFTYEDGDIEHIYTTILKYQAEYGDCRPATFRLLKSQSLHLYPEFEQFYKLNKMGINLNDEPYKSIIRKSLNNILTEVFNNDERIIASKINDKETHDILNSKIADIYNQIENSPEYRAKIDGMLDNLAQIFGSSKLQSFMNTGINATTTIYIIPYIEEFGIDNTTLEACLSLTTDEQRLIISTMRLLKIRNRIESDKELVFTYIRQGKIGDIYEFYHSLLYKNIGMLTVDDIIDTINTKEELSLEEAKQTKEYLLPQNNYIEDEERELFVLRNGRTKFKNHDDSKFALTKKVH